MTTTVKGTTGTEDLGIVAMHEYMLYGLVGWENDPWINFNRPEAFDAIVNALQEFKEAGGKTVVDCGGILLGRDAELLTNIASSAGINIIASSGFGSQDTIPGHYLMPLTEKIMRDKAQEDVEHKMWVPDADFFANMFYKELTEGMALPGMMRSGATAGILMAAGSWDEITEIEGFSLRGAAGAAKRAGVALMIGGINQARRQLEIVLEEGLQPDRIVIGECDDGRAIDLERDKEIAGKGAYVSYDHIGWEDTSVPHAIPDEQRADLVKAMVEAGLTDRIILSCSAIGYAIDVPQPKHSFGHLLKTFVPKLKKAGVSEDAINTILVENPRRILTSKTNL